MTIRLLLHTYLLFLVVTVGFRWRGFYETYSWLRHRTDPKVCPGAEPDSETVHSISEAVQRATRFYFRKQQDCLPKSVTAWHLLRLRGLPAKLCFGVRKFPFNAHAWVECGDWIFDDHPGRIRSYTLLKRLT